LGHLPFADPDRRGLVLVGGGSRLDLVVAHRQRLDREAAFRVREGAADVGAVLRRGGAREDFDTRQRLARGRRGAPPATRAGRPPRQEGEAEDPQRRPHRQDPDQPSEPGRPRTDHRMPPSNLTGRLRRPQKFATAHPASRTRPAAARISTRSARVRVPSGSSSPVSWIAESAIATASSRPPQRPAPPTPTGSAASTAAPTGSPARNASSGRSPTSSQTASGAARAVRPAAARAARWGRVVWEVWGVWEVWVFRRSGVRV